MKRSTARRILRWAVSIGLIAVLYRRVDLGSLEMRLGGIRFAPLALVFPLLLLNTWISALKWRVLLLADGLRVSQGELFVNYMIASFFNVFLPSNIGGDSYRIYSVARATARAGSTVASVLADRLSGFLALSLLGFAFPLAGWELLEPRHMFALPLVVFTLVVALLATLCSPSLVNLGLRFTALGRVAKVRAFADSFLSAVTSYRRQPRALAQVMAISFAFHMTFIACVWLLGQSLGLPVPFFAFCVYVPLVAMLEAVPLSIFGLGLRDAGYVVFMRAAGRPDEDGLAMAVLFVAVSLLYCSIGGVLFALRRRSETAASVPAAGGTEGAA